MTTLRIGTRGSELALYQARTVATRLHEAAGIATDIVVIRTSGDRLAEAPLSEIGGKRLFVKEIEDALLAGEVDLAVHSSKDMSAVLPEGLVIGAVLPREDARDAVVLPGGAVFDDFPLKRDTAGEASALERLLRVVGRTPRIGTSSVRRTAQLRRLWPDAQFEPVRGNLGTRLRKLDRGSYDVLILASAGLIRLEHAHRISAALPVDQCVPAPGQGIIAVEIRSSNAAVQEIVERIDDRSAAAALSAEREVVTRLGGGCQMPLGAYASIAGDRLSLVAVVASLDGERLVRASADDGIERAAALGADVGDRLLAGGAGEILAAVQREQAAAEGGQR
jgi:hydroxymethylbilane synthase